MRNRRTGILIVPALTDEQIVDALSENGYADEAEALLAIIDSEDKPEDAPDDKPERKHGFGQAMRSTRHR